MSDSSYRYIINSKCTCLAAGSQDLWRHSKDCPVVAPMTPEKQEGPFKLTERDEWAWNLGFQSRDAEVEALKAQAAKAMKLLEFVDVECISQHSKEWPKDYEKLKATFHSKT